MSRDWQAIVRRWRRSGLGPVWVVAVSGGSDSVGLLRILHALASEEGLRLSVAHLDHGTRGEEARRDAEFVRELAATLDLAFDLGHWRPSRTAHFEADARRARYDWLAQVARDRGAAAVAVGHTRDDQAETILHRVLRGTGPRGLAGIPARRPLSDSVALVRPLLGVSREELRAHLAALGQPFRDDATNADLSRTRARLRHDLLPRLAREYNPRVAEALVRLGALAAASERAGDATLRAEAKAVTIKADRDTIMLKRPLLRRIPPFPRAEVLRHIWRNAGWPEAGMNARRWKTLARLARSSDSRVALGDGIEFIGDSLFFILKRSSQAPQPPTPPGGHVVIVLDDDAPRDETIDLDALAPPLLVRAPVAGDRFEPLGMGGQSTPLNDFLRGRGVARDRRAGVPLVCDERGIIWVVGHRIAERIRRTDRTRRTAGLRWIADAPDGFGTPLP